MNIIWSILKYIFVFQLTVAIIGSSNAMRRRIAKHYKMPAPELSFEDQLDIAIITRECNEGVSS